MPQHMRACSQAIAQVVVSSSNLGLVNFRTEPGTQAVMSGVHFREFMINYDGPRMEILVQTRINMFVICFYPINNYRCWYY